VSPRSLRLSSSTVVWRRLDALHAQSLAEPAAFAKVLDESCDGDHEGLLISRQRVARQTVAGGGHFLSLDRPREIGQLIAEFDAG